MLRYEIKRNKELFSEQVSQLAMKGITPLLVCRLDLCIAYQQLHIQKIGCWCDLLFLSYALNLNTNNDVKIEGDARDYLLAAGKSACSGRY